MKKQAAHADGSDRAARLARGRRDSLLGMGCNVILFGGKVLLGLASGSVAVVADGVNNLTDAASNIIALLGFKLSAKPADAEHPYGHGRYEYLAGLTVSVLVLVAGVELFKSGVEEMVRPTALRFSWPMALALALTVAVKLGMMFFYRREGARIGSETLQVASVDSRNDAAATGAVLAGMLISQRWGVALDGWLALAVAVFVLWSGFSTLRDTLDLLLGKKPSPGEVEHIREKILACPGVLGTHDLLLHDYGPGRRFASVHVEMAADGDPMVRREALEALERDFLENDGLSMLFQYDPVTWDDTAENRLRAHLEERISAIDPRLAVHDLRLRREEGALRAEFDCFVPADVAIPEEQLRRMLTNIVREQCPDCACRITLDRDYIGAM